MESSTPTVQEWKDLYHAAAMFKEFAPWQWMEDTDVFGVENPETGEIGYCCILGAAGELLGLLVYLGDEGLSLFERLRSGALSPEDEDLHAMQKCLALTFDDREMLDKTDLAVIKSLGLKFRGRQAWPSFRSHLPGFMPWLLNSSEARFLSLALRHSMAVAEKVRYDTSFLRPPKHGSYLVGYVVQEDEKQAWREKWLKPEPYLKRGPTAKIDELRLARIRSQARPVVHSWEVDFFFAPFIVEEGARPFFPYVVLYAVHKAHHVLGFSMAPYSDFQQVFSDNLADTLEKLKVIPKTIIVRKDAVYDFLQPVTDMLGIPLKKAKPLKAIEHAKNSLINHMG